MRKYHAERTALRKSKRNDQNARSGRVIEHLASRLAAEPLRHDELRQQDARTLLRNPEVLPEHVHHGQEPIDHDEIGERKRSNRMVSVRGDAA